MIGDFDEDFEGVQDGDTSLDAGGVVDPAPPQPPDRRALLESLVEAGEGGDLGKLAALALESLTDRENKAAVEQARLQMAADLTPKTIAEIVARYEQVRDQGLDADEKELTDAVRDLADLHDSLRAEVEAQRASELAAQVAGIRGLYEDEDRVEAEAEVAQFLADYDAMKAIEAETGGDLLDENPRWLEYQEQSYYAKREQQAVADLIAERPGQAEREQAEAVADFDSYVDGLAGGRESVG